MSHTYTKLSLLTKHLSNWKVRVLMLIRSEFDIRFQVPAPAAMVAVLHLHPSIESRLRTGNELLIERLTTDVPDSTDYSRTIVPYSEYFDSFGNRCARFIARAGHLRLSNTSVIDADPEPDRIYAYAPQAPIENLPSEVLQFLLPSRYCEVDRFAGIAQDLFGSITPGWNRAVAIRDWVHEKVTFNYNAARPTKTAMDVFTERTGVCRDFQHLAITLSRCQNIPARYVTGYIGDIRMPSSGPGDFSAWYQVFLDDQWMDLDARHNYPRLGRILVATGRDAADVAITTSFGAAYLTHFYVESCEIDSAGNRIPSLPSGAQHPAPRHGISDVNTPTQTNSGQFGPSQTQSATS
jgi:transglutaminase-like putative cysteine protease